MLVFLSTNRKLGAKQDLQTSLCNQPMGPCAPLPSPSTRKTRAVAKERPKKSLKRQRATSPRLNENPYRTLVNPQSQKSAICKPRSRQLKQRPDVSNRYWCTICVDPHSYQKSDDWKKHMKEHETSFICGLTSAAVVEDGVMICAYCGAQNPDTPHLASHNDRACSTSSGRTAFKRRYEMVAHLKQQHGATDTKSLAERWRHMRPKKAWSCGFCIKYFSNLGEQLKHLDQNHFRMHQHVSLWDNTKVIQGLLLQPLVYEAWHNLMSTYGLRTSIFTWNNHRAQPLQNLLQTGPSKQHDPAFLAKTAYDYADDPEAYGFALPSVLPEPNQNEQHVQWNNGSTPMGFPGYSALENNDFDNSIIDRGLDYNLQYGLN